MSLVVLMLGNSIAFANKIFTDVPENHWAIDEINKMNDLGIITGMTADTFNPNLEVPVSQAIVMMVRMINPARTEINAGMNIYNDLINAVGVETWAKDQMAYALLKGIITEGELRSSYVNGKVKTAEKLEIVRYLTRALGLEDEAKNKEFIILGFNDSDEIPEIDIPHVNMMIEVGVINEYGDVLGNFNPKDTVTRAMMAKMLSEAYDYKEGELAKRNKDFIGIIEEIQYGEPHVIIVKDGNNITHQHDLSQDAKITKGTTALTILDIKFGNEVDVKIVDDVVTSINLRETTVIPTEENVEGVITSITVTDKVEIHLRDNNGIDRSYTISQNLVTLLDQKSSNLLDLRSGYNAKLTLTNNQVTVIYAEAQGESLTDRYTGKIEFVDKDLKAFIIRPEGQTPMRIDTTNSTNIVNLIGNDTSFNAVTINKRVTVIGEEINGRFVANTVVITE